MASTSALLPLPAASLRPRASAGRRPAPPKSANWWTPIFGWSPEPDYIDPPQPSSAEESKPPTSAARGVVFTEAKARKLRMSMLEASSFHDAMYHSAIASRLASDFKGRSSARAGDK